MNLCRGFIIAACVFSTMSLFAGEDNLLKNPELALSGKTKTPISWKSSKGVVISSIKGDHPEGKEGIKVKASKEGFKGFLAQGVSFAKAGEYEFSAWVKCPVSGMGYIFIRQRNGDNSFRAKAKYCSQADKWVKLVIRFNVVNPSLPANIYLRYAQKQKTAEKEVYFSSPYLKYCGDK